MFKGFRWSILEEGTGKGLILGRGQIELGKLWWDRVEGVLCSAVGKSQLMFLVTCVLYALGTVDLRSISE